MLIKTDIWLYDKSYSIERDHAFNSNMQVAVSYSLVCPLCQQIWARHIILDRAFVWPRAQFCEFCATRIIPGGWNPVPGSLLSEEGWGVIDDTLLNSLPLELLQREFKLHLKALDNGNFTNSPDNSKLRESLTPCRS